MGGANGKKLLSSVSVRLLCVCVCTGTMLRFFCIRGCKDQPLLWFDSNKNQCRLSRGFKHAHILAYRLTCSLSLSAHEAYYSHPCQIRGYSWVCAQNIKPRHFSHGSAYFWYSPIHCARSSCTCACECVCICSCTVCSSSGCVFIFFSVGFGAFFCLITSTRIFLGVLSYERKIKWIENDIIILCCAARLLYVWASERIHIRE